MATIGDNPNKKANPQNSGDGAPVFVNDHKEFMGYLMFVRTGLRVGSKEDEKAMADYGKKELFGYLGNRGWWLCLGFAISYALVFTVAEGWFPRLYQAWLDFCMPLAEYVGGLTPRADRTTGQLIAGGYPERADDALHGIAMAQILAIPMFIYTLRWALFGTRLLPVFVSCTRGTHIKVWLRWLFGIAFACALAMVFCWGYMTADEKIGGITGGIGQLAKYHRGNFAMVMGILFLACTSMFFAIPAMFHARIRSIRFTIVKQKPEDMQDFAAFMSQQEKAAKQNSGDNADTADKEETPPN